jgi:hypothetical protein
MFERRHQNIAPTSVFIKRLVLWFGVAFLLILVALFIGIAGYHWTAGLGWIDSLLNASMILGGMGPVDQLTNPAAKIFASLYALFSGLVFIAVMGVVFSPILHRMLHKFHLDEKDLRK